jgi:aconitate hydratase
VTIIVGKDPLLSRKRLEIGNNHYDYFSITKAETNGLDGVSHLPVSLKILLENVLRFCSAKEKAQAFSHWIANNGRYPCEIPFYPNRVLLQDFTGVPALVDLASMRQKACAKGIDPQTINPLCPVDLVIDHSVTVDQSGNARALWFNTNTEIKKNRERYEFLKWGQKNFQNFRVIPPGMGICHQINLEYLAETVRCDVDQDNNAVAFPDTLVGADSHTTMINGLSALGWGVGGIEAESVMMGQPLILSLPEVVGLELTGEFREGITATDLVLTITQFLRTHGVVGKFVEFFGSGLDSLALEDRATIANMAPEYGGTCGFFPVDEETIRYMHTTGRSLDNIAIVEAYAKANGLWRTEDNSSLCFTERLSLDISTVVPSVAGPKRPQDRINLSNLNTDFAKIFLPNASKIDDIDPDNSSALPSLQNGDIVLSAITSCTNTSNPRVMIGAGLVAQKAIQYGLTAKPWVKTSLAPGSQVVSQYLENSGLQESLDTLGFHTVGYGCTTCIGNSGPLLPDVETALKSNPELTVASVLSGNRNFEGRINALVKANYLVSPLLCVAFSILGTVQKNITTDPIGFDSNHKPVYLKDIWPTQNDISEILKLHVSRTIYQNKYKNIFDGDAHWKKISSGDSVLYPWDSDSTYIQNPPYFEDFDETHHSLMIENAYTLCLLGDSVTTDHISPAGKIHDGSPAALYLEQKGIAPADFNSYGARRGNHEVMMRGTFSNPLLSNSMIPEKKGGYTKHIPSDDIMTIYDAAMSYGEAGIPIIVVAGKEYGSGSSRDWAAKGPALLGVRAVIAESFERIHRSNLVGLGIFPLEFPEGISANTLNLIGNEKISIQGDSVTKPNDTCDVAILYPDGRKEIISCRCRIDTKVEMDYIACGGILRYMLNHLSN